jgi:hypothetical protein
MPHAQGNSILRILPVWQGQKKGNNEKATAASCSAVGVEQNALPTGMVERAEQWRWSSLWRWRHPEVTEDVPPLTAWNR